MTYDYDASGIEIDPKDFEEYSRFIRTWLQNKRLKHEADIVPIRREHTHLGAAGHLRRRDQETVQGGRRAATVLCAR